MGQGKSAPAGGEISMYVLEILSVNSGQDQDSVEHLSVQRPVAADARGFFSRKSIYVIIERWT